MSRCVAEDAVRDGLIVRVGSVAELPVCFTTAFSITGVTREEDASGW